MRKSILSSLAVLPLLLSFSTAEQNWSVAPPPPNGFPSEDSSTGSYLGVDISDVTTERLSALKLKEEKGVEVTMVDQDAPAGKAGIKEHDVILSMNGSAIESQVQLKRMIRETPPGRVVSFDISRDGQAMTIKVQLADRRKQYAWGPKMKDFHVEIPPIPDINIEVPQINVMVVRSSARSGLMVENITPQLGEFFGVKNGNGVLVRAVEKGSRGEKAGFRAGDVIVKINDQPVHDTSDFTEVMHSHESGAVGVAVIREKKEQKLNLELPPHKESGYLIDEESMDVPLFDAEDEIEMSQAEDEIAELQPEMELVSEQSEQATEAEDAVRQAVCEAQQQAQAQQEVQEGVQEQQTEQLKGLQDQMKAQTDALKSHDALKSQIDQMLQQQDLLQKHQRMTREQRKMKREQEKMMIEIERLRQDSQKHGFDI